MDGPDLLDEARGLIWLPVKDVSRFQFDAPPVDPDEVLIKCKVLSSITTLFDPVGIISATTIVEKAFMQFLGFGG